ncbi:MAG: C-terminal binding protein [Alphaproteobacteria bacterium]|nr:C-terminal binding protein [Alphaproteobacteria bacterium]
MLVVLSQFPHGVPDLEKRTAQGRCELYIQTREEAETKPIPAAIRAKADAIVHYPAGTTIEGKTSDWPNVRAVLRSGVGYDMIDVAAWTKRNVAVFNVPDYGTSEVADHAIALMLALTRGTSSYHDLIRANPTANWHHLKAPVVRRLRGCTFGVVGLGRIGLAAALRARAFGMDIAFCDPFQPAGYEIAVGAKRVKTPAELAAISDVLSIHAPSAPETAGLIGKDVFAKAKKGLVLINTARGAIVDLEALYDALKSKRVAAAGLDVLPEEPANPNNRLVRAFLAREAWLEGRLTLSPHAAFYSPASLVDMRVSSLTNVLAHLETGSLAACVNAAQLKTKSK